MSWEIDWEKEYPCPCGKGKYKVISKSDDWNRTKEEYVMFCKECKDKYNITKRTYGIKERFVGYECVLKNQKSK